MAERGSGADQTRERIEEVAFNLLLENGYDGTPLRRIAEAANVTTPALYWHFSSKADLCARVVAKEYEDFARVITAAVKPGPAGEQLRAYVVSFVQYQLNGRTAAIGLGFDDLVASVPDTERGRITAIQRPLHDLLRKILVDGYEQRLFSTPNPTVTAFAISTMCTYVFGWFKPDGRLSVNEVAQGYADIAIRLAGGRPELAVAVPDIAPPVAGGIS